MEKLKNFLWRLLGQVLIALFGMLVITMIVAFFAIIPAVFIKVFHVTLQLLGEL